MTLVSDAFAIARAGIRAADPEWAVRRVLRRGRDGFVVGSARLRTRTGGRVHLLSIGKAAGAMVDAASRIAGPDALGLAVTPAGSPAPRSGIPVRYGEHPVPGAGSFRAGAAVLEYVRATESRDTILFLLSGGGSSALELPGDRLSPADLARTTKLLLASGAPIGATNTVRRHLSALKGGRLAVASVAATFATVAISDVVGDPPTDIASGPTVVDPTTFRDARAVVDRYRIRPRLPSRVKRHLREGVAGRVPETPKPGASRFRRRPYVLAATNAGALAAAAREARARRYDTRILTGPIVGETQPAARRFARTLRSSLARARGPIALLAGGETTLTLGRRPGRGGRNQEFALAAAEPIAHGRRAMVLSLGTDGVDGPTDAAGGWTDERTLGLAQERAVDVGGALRRHATYEALALLGGLFVTGPTGTNVMDLHIGLARPHRPSRAGRG
jgi:glycerate 2-kinase